MARHLFRIVVAVISLGVAWHCLPVAMSADEKAVTPEPAPRRPGDLRTPDKVGVGDPAPEFTLKSLDGKRSVALSDFRGKKPVLLIFGCYTCPPFRRQIGPAEQLFKKYDKDVEIFLVYIREAHPTDGWQVAANEKEQILFAQPKTLADRTVVAETMQSKLKLDVPLLIDGIDNKTCVDYAGWPNRLYIIGIDGKIIYKSGPGPGGFKPEELTAALDKYLPTLSAKN